MRKTIVLLTFLGIFSAPSIVFAASPSDMEKECKTIARKMMEEPATFKYIDAGPASKDNNTGVVIRYTGTKDDFNAKLSCFYANGEISKLHLVATLKDGEAVDEYLADFLVDQIKKDIRAK